MALRRKVDACAVLCAVGLTLNITWCSLVGHTSTFAEDLLGFRINARVFYLAGILVTGALFMAAPRWVDRRRGAIGPVVAVAASFGTLCLAIASEQATLPSFLLSVGGLALLGVGYAWFASAFVAVLADRRPFSTVAACLTCALVVEPVLVRLEERFADPTVAVVATAALPLACGVLLASAPRFAVAGGGAQVADARVPERAASFEARVAVVLVCVAAVLLASVSALGFVGTWGADNIFPARETESVVPAAVLRLGYALLMVLFCVLCIVRTGRWPLRSRFQPAFAVVITTLCLSLLLARDAGVDPAAVDALTRLNDSFADLLMWASVCVLMVRAGRPWRPAGLALCLYAAISIAWMLFRGVRGEGTLVAAVVVYAASLAVMWFGLPHDVRGRGQACLADAAAPADAAGPAPSLADVLDRRCAEVSGRYGLSPRESQILLLLAEGRTRPYIQAELSLSENTVKTHVAHIYAKLSVVDKTGLMDVVLGVPKDADGERA